MINIIIDTNVLISAVFFGGEPERVIRAIRNNVFNACANQSIINEYYAVRDRMLSNRYSETCELTYTQFVEALSLYPEISAEKVCRDPSDDKFINCAIDSNSLYIVSGDKDLLDVKGYRDIKIVTVRDFCKLYL